MYLIQKLERVALLTLLKVLLIHGKVQMFICFVDDRVAYLQDGIWVRDKSEIKEEESESNKGR